MSEASEMTNLFGIFEQANKFRVELFIMKKEIEVKIQLNKKENIAKKLKALGWEKRKSYTQTTYGFFSDDSIEKGIFPRIRMENKVPVFTVKVKNNKKKSEYFERDEYSVKISDLRNGVKILQLLGYKRIRKFTKFREEWFFNKKSIKITVDRLYFGNFLEIEGSKKEIEKTIKDLGFQDRRKFTKAYLALEDEFKLKNKTNKRFFKKAGD